jgi:subtilisin family serine protease
MKKKIVAILMVMIMVISVTVVLAGSATDKDTKTKEPVIIGFKSTPGPADKAIVRGHGGDIKYSYTIINAIAAKLPEPAIENIQKNPRVTYVEMDGEVHTLDTELDKSWGVKRIGAGTVHDSGNKGSGVKVAILDTGIDYNHPDLNANYNDGGYDYVNNDNDPMDDNGHGTHCAGIVAAEDDGNGVVGVAPEAYLYAVKVLDNTGIGYWSDVIAGIQWSVNNNMEVISMSFGGGDGVGMKAACDAAAGDIVIVASAGNSGNPPGKGDNVGYPAGYSSVIAVAATDSNDNRARWSSTGPAVELAAPGVDIKSTYLGGGYATKSGTSMACPHVAGTAALAIVAGEGDVRQCLQDTADDLGDEGRDNLYGYGLVDADGDALPDTRPPSITNVASSAITSTSATITWDTDELSDSLVKYDIEQGIYNFEVSNSADVTTHSVVLTELQSNRLYYYVVNSIDPSGNPAQSSEHTFTTKEASGNSMHVKSIDMSTDSKTRGRNTFEWAVATVTIFDESESPVEGATVFGHWSDATTDSDSGVTDASGQVSLESDSVKTPPSGTTFTFTVDDVTKDEWTYDSGANKETSAIITV